MRHKCLGIFLAVLFVPLFLISFTLLNLKMTIFNVNFIKSELQKASFYTLTEQYTPKIVDQTLQNKTGSKEIVLAVQNTFKADWVKNQIETNLDNIYAWFYGKSETLKITFSLSAIKDNFFNELEKTYNSLPVCASTKASEESLGGELSCRPPGMSFSTFKSEIDKEMQKTDEKLFEDFVFDENLQNSMPLAYSSPGITLNWIFYITAFLSLIVLILIAILARESWQAFLRWIGIPLAIPSFILLIIFLISRIVLKSNLGLSFILPRGSDNFSLALNIIEPFFKTLNLDISNRKLLEAGIIFGFSVILIIISFFVKKKGEISTSSASEG